ncbi:MAG: YqhG family protein [Halobacillus sp.]|uniref:YqhG family protein n=1 Tax=Halobacillus sp. TaxID=56800 RepID=UPI003BB17824
MTLNPYFDFVHQFFTSYGCAILEKSESHLKVQLTSTMDEEIMNRPFYWHYMKKMNRPGDPMQLLFTNTSHSKEGGIYLHAGTPKLHTIYRAAINKGKTARLYEAVEKPLQNRALCPWLVVNIHLHYRGKQSKDDTLSLGLNLVHGTLLFDMMERLWKMEFEPTVSDYTFPMTPLINLENAYKRIERYVEGYVSSISDDWATRSLKHLQEEKNLLESFYSSEDIGLEQFTKEQEQIDTRYSPRILMEVVNGGLFYISQKSNSNVIKNLAAD